MRSPKSILLIGCLIIGWSTFSHAGFGDLLKKIEDSGKQILGGDSPSTGTALDSDTIIRGLKEALAVGTEKAVDVVSQTDGYWGNPQIRIPLPGPVEQAGGLMRKVGLGSTVDQFELSMNRAAEKAAPAARDLFVQSLQAMSIEDARNILNGPEDAATQYFRKHTEGPLGERFLPIIRDSMNQVGVTSYYQQLESQVSQMPLAGQWDLNLEQHVTQRALDGLFQMLAIEEKRIREDPVARTSDLLKQVFGR